MMNLQQILIVKSKDQNRPYKQKTIEDEDKAAGLSRKTCFKCGKPNHIAEYYPNPRMICFNCPKIGLAQARRLYCTTNKVSNVGKASNMQILEAVVVSPLEIKLKILSLTIREQNCEVKMVQNGLR